MVDEEFDGGEDSSLKILEVEGDGSNSKDV